MCNISRYGPTDAIRVFLILMVGAACPFTTVGESYAQQSLFTKDVIQKWKEFESFSRTIQGTKRETFTSTAIAQNQPQRSSVSYKQNPECVLLSAPVFKVSGATSTRNWILVNSRYKARITTDDSDPNQVVLKTYEPNSAKGSSNPEFDDLFSVLAPHFSYQNIRLSQLVTKESFKVQKISKSSRDGYELIQVDFSFDDKNQGVQSSGSLYLDPGHCWCIRRISDSYVKMLKGKPFLKFQQSVDYQISDHPSGFPLIKHESRHAQGYSGKEKVESTNKIDYEWEINDHVPDSEFTLTAFGLPEPVGVTWEKPTPWYLWFLAAAGGCFVLTVLFRYLSRRWRQRAA